MKPAWEGNSSISFHLRCRLFTSEELPSDRKDSQANRIRSLHIDRRRAARVTVDLSVQFRICPPSCPDVASPFIPAAVHNLSDDGISLLTDTIHSDGLHIILHPTVSTLEQCLLEIEIPYGDQPLTLKGKAVWYDRNPGEHPSVYRVGVRFLNMDQNLRGKIRALTRE